MRSASQVRILSPAPFPDSFQLRCIEVSKLQRQFKQGYPSGQRGSVQVAVRSASQVRILPPAPLCALYPSRILLDFSIANFLLFQLTNRPPIKEMNMELNKITIHAPNQWIFDLSREN